MQLNQQRKKPILLKDLGMSYPMVKSKQKKRFAIYICSCGNEFKAMTSNINRGITTSCGCYHSEKSIECNTIHGLSKNRIYPIWAGMKERCNNKNNKAFSDYGGRGIKVCERWHDVKNFIDDMYPTYKEGLSIDRIDNDGNYEPSNCRWATRLVQSRNQRVISASNKSGYRGVCFSKRSKKWQATICVNNKNKVIGLFETAIEAGIAYDEYVISNNLEHTINGIIKKML